MRQGITNDVALKGAIRTISEMEFSIPEPVSYTRWLAHEAGIPRERLITVLEDVIREGISVTEKDGEDIKTYEAARSDIIDCMMILGTFPNYNMLPLVKEGLKSQDDIVRSISMIRYIRITGEIESIPFLRETLPKDGMSMSRSGIYWQLGDAVARLKDAGKNDDAEKILAFLMERTQTEMAPFSISGLDIVLCNAISDYANSVQRQQAIQKFLDSNPAWERELYDRRKSELDALPADQRTDLSARFNLAPPPNED